MNQRSGREAGQVNLSSSGGDKGQHFGLCNSRKRMTEGNRDGGTWEQSELRDVVMGDANSSTSGRLTESIL